MFFVEYSFEELAQKMAEEIQRDSYEKAKKEIEDELRGKGATDVEIAQELKKYDEDNNRTKNSEIKEIKQRFINEAMKNATRKVTVEERQISEDELEENRRKASMEIGAERYSGVEIYGAPIIETQRRMGINRNSTIQALRERYLAYKRSNAVSDYTIQADEVMFSNMARMIHSLNIKNIDIPREFETADELEVKKQILSLFPITMLEDDFFLDSFFKYLKKERGMKDSSIRNTVMKYQAFYHYCSDKQGVLKKSQYKVKSAELPIKALYTQEQLDKILEKPKNIREGFEEYRNWVICMYVYNTGNRLSSFTNLQMKDLKLLDSGRVVVQKTKANKPYTIAVPEKICDVIREYVNIWRLDAKDNDYLFCNINGEKMKTNSLSYSLSRYIQRRIGKDAPHSIHLLRHQYASFFIEHGGDMFKLQKQLQHSSLKMVKHYAVHYGYTKQELIEDFSPINFSTPKGMKKKLVPAPAPTKKKGK